MALTRKRELFVQFYTAIGEKSCGNGAESARLAGYSARSAKQMAHFLLTIPCVQQAIEQKRREIEESPEITRAEVVRAFREDRRAALEKDDLKTAVNCLENLAKIGGHYRADNTQKAERSLWFTPEQQATLDSLVVGYRRQLEGSADVPLPDQ
ncbi:MAG: terminase small subunit [Phycisphaerales bacterium]|nr:MAG: terminase small subunit [Phycisphaerales bacterium]